MKGKFCSLFPPSQAMKLDFKTNPHKSVTPVETQLCIHGRKVGSNLLHIGQLHRQAINLWLGGIVDLQKMHSDLLIGLVKILY